MPEAFHARFSVSVIRLRRSCVPPVGLPAVDEAPRRTREKTSGTNLIAASENEIALVPTPLKARGEACILITVTSSTRFICFLRRCQ